MEIILYTNDSDNKVVNKSISELKRTQASLLEPTDHVNPSITVERDAISQLANYLFIEEFGRYYYIEDIIFETNSRLRYNCHVDVLMTYKFQIGESTQIITRSSDPAVYNSYLNDGMFQAQSNMQIQQKILKVDKFNTRLSTTDEGTANYILTTVNGKLYEAPEEAN